MENNNVIDSLRFSLFYDVKKGIYTTTPIQQITFKRLINIYQSEGVKKVTHELQEANDKDKPELKKLLPFITPYGTFNPTRNKESIASFNASLICLDIDNVSNSDARLIKVILSKQTSTLLCVISPRGRGVKAFILISDTTPLNECYNTLKLNKEHIAKSIGLIDFLEHIDNAQFNITQPMFIAFDESLYYNEFAQPLSITLTKYIQPIIKRVAITNVPIKAKNRIETYLINATNRLIEFFALCSEGNRHANIIKVQTIASWIHYAPGLESEIKQRLYNACCSMYGSEKEALKNGVERAFNKAWTTENKANNSIELIINELNSVA
jgi:hypothetical protein